MTPARWTPAFAAEALKLRRSSVVWVTTVVLVVVPASLARGFLAAAEHGGEDPASLKARATLPGEGWTGYLGGLMQVYATAGLLGAGIVVGWCFGREFVDRTVVALYAAATPRDAVAAAKLVLLACWAAALAPATVVTAVLLGVATGLGPPDAAAWQGAARLAALAALSGLLSLPVALAASVGRGYLPAVGGLLALVVLAQVAAVGGVGGWWPWSVPAVWAMAPDVAGEAPGAGRLLLAPVAVLAAAVVTVRWWRRAEAV